MKAKLFVGYYRVSTDKQDNSARFQPIKIKDFADYKNIEVLEIFGDEDVSGGIVFSERDGGKKLIKTIERNPNIDGIIVTNLTRAFRDAIDGLSMLTKWTHEGLAVFVIDEGGIIDVTTPDGFINALIKLGISHWERLTIKKRTKDALASMKKHGMRYAKDRYGYEAVEGKFIPNESEQKVIQSVIQMNLSGFSYSHIAEELNSTHIPTKRGGKWHHSTIKNIIHEHSIQKGEPVSRV